MPSIETIARRSRCLADAIARAHRERALHAAVAGRIVVRRTNVAGLTCPAGVARTRTRGVARAVTAARLRRGTIGRAIWPEETHLALRASRPGPARLADASPVACLTVQAPKRPVGGAIARGPARRLRHGAEAVDDERSAVPPVLALAGGPRRSAIPMPAACGTLIAELRAH